MDIENFIEDIHQITGNTFKGELLSDLLEYIQNLENFSLAHQRQWDYWQEHQSEGDNWIDIEELNKVKKELEETNKQLLRVQKERNFLGDYIGGITSEEELSETEGSAEEEEKYEVNIDDEGFQSLK